MLATGSITHPAVIRSGMGPPHPCCILSALCALVHCPALRVQAPSATFVPAICFSPGYWKMYVQDAGGTGSSSWNRALFLASIKLWGDFQVTESSDTLVSSC